MNWMIFSILYTYLYVRSLLLNAKIFSTLDGNGKKKKRIRKRKHLKYIACNKRSNKYSDVK